MSTLENEPDLNEILDDHFEVVKHVRTSLRKLTKGYHIYIKVGEIRRQVIEIHCFMNLAKVNLSPIGKHHFNVRKYLYNISSQRLGELIESQIIRINGACEFLECFLGSDDEMIITENQKMRDYFSSIDKEIDTLERLLQAVIYPNDLYDFLT
ncbi:MAG: hypothetical protein RLP15_08390 [Cryomorphaceae bacterium]